VNICVFRLDYIFPMIPSATRSNEVQFHLLHIVELQFSFILQRPSNCIITVWLAIILSMLNW